MRYFLLLSFFFFCGFCNAQILPGKYFNYNKQNGGVIVVFFKDSHFSLTFDGTTIGGEGTMQGDKLLAGKYVINRNEVPKQIDLIIYDRNTGKEMMKMKGIYEQVDTYSLNIAFSSSSNIRPKKFDDSFCPPLNLVIDTPENYPNLLWYHEQGDLFGFSPEVKVNEKSDGVKEILYLQKGQLLNSKAYQTREVRKYDGEGRLLKTSRYDIDGKLYVNRLGFTSKVLAYNKNGKVELEQYYKNESELMFYNGKVFPEVKYTYKDTVLVQIDKLINVDSLKMSQPVVTRYIYDSYGDIVDWQEYYADGRQKEDSQKILITGKLRKWIDKYAKYPLSFEPLVFGSFSNGYVSDENGIQANTETYTVYTEFYLNDTAGLRRNFTGFFQFDYKFDLTDLSRKTKAGIEIFQNWKQADYDTWFALFCRKLTPEEQAQRAAEKRRRNLEILDIIDEAVGKDNTEVFKSGAVKKKDIKKLKKAAKMVKRKIEKEVQ